MRYKLILAFLFVFILFTGNLFSQKSKDGSYTVTTSNEVLNRYSELDITVMAGSSILVVKDINELNGTNTVSTVNPYANDVLSAGDLVMVIKMQGASMDITNTPAYGSIANYNGVGNYELIEVGSVNGNTITIANGCSVIKGYTVSTTQRVQVVRIPRLINLVISPLKTITAPAWRSLVGTSTYVGGIVAIEASGNINNQGSITVWGKGFKGGDIDNTTMLNPPSDYVTTNSQHSAEKGESIVGNQADYDLLGGRYGKGAPANGGGGGNAHNSGGGGGSNGDNGISYNGLGVPDVSNINYIVAWSFEPMVFGNNIGTSGGGRGGYTFSQSNQDATTTGPGNAAWGGDSRQTEGGLGGKPLDTLNHSCLFLGGGGGAGEGNDNPLSASAGADGGGIIYIKADGNIIGVPGSFIDASGKSADATINDGTDGAGGGGGGGSISVFSGGIILNQDITVRGGNGGDQNINTPPTNQAEGPGGGGGGGFIILTAPYLGGNTDVLGGDNGVTNATALTEFPPNGATSGGTGTVITNAAFPGYTLNVDLHTIASGNSPTCLGASKTYTFIVTNKSEFTSVSNITVTVPIPSAITIISSTTSTGTYASSVWTIGLLNPGASATLSVLGTITATTIPPFNVTASAGISECNVANNVGPVGTATVTDFSLSVSETPTVICSGSTSTLNVSGAASYTWNPGLVTGPTVTMSPATTTNYTVTGVLSGCTHTTAVTLSVNITPTITASATSTIICSGKSSTLSASGANTYTWNPGPIASSVVVTPTTTTIYTVTGTNTLGGCTHSIVTTVSVNTTPTISTSPTATTICSGKTTTLTSSGADTYTWNPGSPGSTIAVTPGVTTNYTITGTNTLGGCTHSIVTTVSVNTTPTISTSPSATTICAGKTIILTSSGANTYTWNPGAPGSTIAVTPTATTNYTVTGTNTLGGCTHSIVATVSVNTTPTISTSPSATIICSGKTITLTSSGANTYTWNPGPIASSVAVTPTATTIYTVKGTNTVSGCTNSVAVTVSVNTTPTLTTLPGTITICSGNTTTLISSGANTYTWNPGSPGSTIAVTPSATTIYTVTGTNTLGGCTNSVIATVSVNTTPTISASPSMITICSGNTTTLTSSGANTYTWNPGSPGSTIAVTPSATTIYTVTGTNTLGGCTNSIVATVSVNMTPTILALPSVTTICSGNTTTLFAYGTDTYTWNPGSIIGSTNAVTPSATTVYTITGTNTLGGCTNSVIATVSVNTTPTISASPSTITICSGNTTTLTAAGANTFTWNPGSIIGSTNAVTPSATTVYTVTGTNTLGGCTNSAMATVSVSLTPTILAFPSISTICSGNTTILFAYGASTFTWNPGSIIGSTNAVTPSVTTIYTVTGTNTLGGCTNSTTATVSVNITPTVTTFPGMITICSGNSITLTASGANTFTWNPGSPGSTLAVTPTATTIYTVTGTNTSGGCTNSIVTTVSVNSTPTLTVLSSTPTICSGSSLTLNAFGANTYTWNPGALTGALVIVSPSSSVVYSVSGISVAGCISPLFTLNITVNPNPTVIANSNTPAICLGGTTALTAMGALVYQWNPGTLSGSSISVNPSSSTVYTVTGTNTLGCTNTQTVNLTVNANPTLGVSLGSPTICYGQTTSLSATGAVTYTWYPVLLSGASISVTPAVNTTYTVTGTNNLGCTDTQTSSIIVNPNPTVIPFCSDSIICNGESTAINTAGAVSYTWLPGFISGSSVSVSPVSSTIYTVTGTNSFGCTSINTLPIYVSPTPTLTVVASETLICYGQKITISAVGANTYTWSPGGFYGNTFTASPASTVVYIVSGTSSLGCTSPPAIITISATSACANPILGIAKAASIPVKTEDGTFDITYTITVKNMGNEILKNIQVKDDLENSIPLPAIYQIKVEPNVTGSLTANLSYNGSSNVNLLNSTLSKLAPGEIETIIIKVNVNVNSLKQIRNSASGTAIGMQSGNGVSDISGTGFNPDVNENNNPNEPEDNNATITDIPEDTGITLPQGFSPNNDGVNDFFVISGINEFPNCNLKILNRWGNVVYEANNYDNTWNGKSNVGIKLGSGEDLPDGTYFYLLDLGVEQKNYKGYIYLNRTPK